MKKIELTYKEIELLQFIVKNFITISSIKFYGVPDNSVSTAALNRIDALRVKLIKMRAQMEYEKRD